MLLKLNRYTCGEFKIVYFIKKCKTTVQMRLSAKQNHGLLPYEMKVQDSNSPDFIVNSCHGNNNVYPLLHFYINRRLGK